MENKENKADLEQLLNTLIEKGWRIENPKARISDVKYMYGLRELRIVYETDRRDALRKYPIRFLVSKESNLWQFVCEMSVYNNYNKEKGKVLTWEKVEDDKYQINGYSNGGGYIQDYEYRLIESALKDESELEEFLLSNIKVDE